MFQRALSKIYAGKNHFSLSLISGGIGWEPGEAWACACRIKNASCWAAGLKKYMMSCGRFLSISGMTSGWGAWKLIVPAGTLMSIPVISLKKLAYATFALRMSIINIEAAKRERCDRD